MSSREEIEVHLQHIRIWNCSGYSRATLEVHRQGKNILKILKKIIFYLRVLCLVKSFIMWEDRIKKFSDIQFLKKFTFLKLFLRKLLEVANHLKVRPNHQRIVHRVQATEETTYTHTYTCTRRAEGISRVIGRVPGWLICTKHRKKQGHADTWGKSKKLWPKTV